MQREGEVSAMLLNVVVLYAELHFLSLMLGGGERDRNYSVLVHAE